MDFLDNSREGNNCPFGQRSSLSLEDAGQGRSRRGLRFYYSFAPDVVPYFGEHDLGCPENGSGLKRG